MFQTIRMCICVCSNELVPRKFECSFLETKTFAYISFVEPYSTFGSDRAKKAIFCNHKSVLEAKWIEMNLNRKAKDKQNIDTDWYFNMTFLEQKVYHSRKKQKCKQKSHIACINNTENKAKQKQCDVWKRYIFLWFKEKLYSETNKNPYISLCVDK